MAEAKRPAPFPNDPNFGDLAGRVEEEIEYLRELMQWAERYKLDVSAREDVSLLGELEHRLRDAALACRVEAIFQGLLLPYVNRRALPRRVRSDRDKKFKVIGGYNIEPARGGLRKLVIPTDLFLVSNEGTLHTLRADRIGPPIGYWHRGHKRVGVWAAFVEVLPFQQLDPMYLGTGERKGIWPFARNEFGPFDPERLIRRSSEDPYLDLISFTQLLEGAVLRVRHEMHKLATSRLEEIRHRAGRLEASNAPPM